MKKLNIALWIAQILMALLLVWAGFVKLFLPIEKLSAMWPWTGQISPFLLKSIAVIDLLVGIGLVLPWLLRIQPKLTPLAASALVLLMICACIFHISRGEASLIGFNVFVGLVAAFVAWGRLKKAQVRPA